MFFLSIIQAVVHKVFLWNDGFICNILGVLTFVFTSKYSDLDTLLINCCLIYNLSNSLTASVSWQTQNVTRSQIFLGFNCVALCNFCFDRFYVNKAVLTYLQQLIKPF